MGNFIKVYGEYPLLKVLANIHLHKWAMDIAWVVFSYYKHMWLAYFNDILYLFLHLIVLCKYGCILGTQTKDA